MNNAFNLSRFSDSTYSDWDPQQELARITEEEPQETYLNG